MPPRTATTRTSPELWDRHQVPRTPGHPLANDPVTITNESGTRKVYLKLRNLRVSDYSVAQVDGDLANGDQIWVEHKDGTTWVACAKSTVPSDTLATWVNSTGYYNPNIYMRACISFSVHGNRSTVCGTPVKDHPES